MSSSDSVAEMQRRRKAMEQHAVKLMLDRKTNPKDVMEISGCRYEVGTKDYNRLYQKAYRKRKILQQAEHTKRIKSLNKRNANLSAKQESIQQLKRQINNAVAQSRQSLTNQKGMQIQIDKLQKRQEATTRQLRAVALDNVSLRKKASKTKLLTAKLGFI